MSGSDEIAGEPPKYDNYLAAYKAFWVCGDHDFIGLGRNGLESREEFLETLGNNYLDHDADIDITRMTKCPMCGRGSTSGRGCGWYTFTPFDFYV